VSVCLCLCASVRNFLMVSLFVPCSRSRHRVNPCLWVFEFAYTRARILRLFACLPNAIFSIFLNCDICVVKLVQPQVPGPGDVPSMDVSCGCTTGRSPDVRGARPPSHPGWVRRQPFKKNTGRKIRNKKYVRKIRRRKPYRCEHNAAISISFSIEKLRVFLSMDGIPFTV